MFYVKLKRDGSLERYPYTLIDLKRDNPNTSFPQYIDDETAALFGALPVQPTNPPTESHLVNLSRTAEKRGDVWVEVWLEEPATTEQIAERTLYKSNDVRNIRNRLLAESDWTQMADVPLSDSKKAEWINYRQVLRDLTNQDGFPWKISIPKKII